MSREILTDGNGRPIERPERADYATDLEYVRAYHAWKDAVADVATRAFDSAFEWEMRR